MRRSPKNYDVLTITKVTDEDRLIPHTPFAKYMMVSRALFYEDAFEVCPLTFSLFFRAAAYNFLEMNYYRLLWFLFDLGFIKTKEGERINLSDFRFAFWRSIDD